jgi:hypothetical protein
MSTRSLVTMICMATSLSAAGCATASNNVTGPTGTERPGMATPPTLPSDQASCAAPNAEWAIGSDASNELLEKARLAAKAAVARFVVRGQPITTEYLGKRLNLEIDERRLVVAVRCG